jgi:hypothetical protein
MTIFCSFSICFSISSIEQGIKENNELGSSLSVVV